MAAGELTKNGVFEREALGLGGGDILWADEGFGPRAAAALHEAYLDRPDTLTADGGTLGFGLMNLIASSRRLLVFDCCELHAEPGTLRVLREKDVALWTSTKLSPHQTGMSELLGTAALLGEMPESVAVIGIQPSVLDDYGGSLSPAVRARLGEAVALAAAVLAEWGLPHESRPADRPAAPLTADCLAVARYEAERPSEEDACRRGDDRFFMRMPDAAPAVGADRHSSEGRE